MERILIRKIGMKLSKEKCWNMVLRQWCKTQTGRQIGQYIPRIMVVVVMPNQLFVHWHTKFKFLTPIAHRLVGNFPHLKVASHTEKIAPFETKIM